MSSSSDEAEFDGGDVHHVSPQHEDEEEEPTFLGIPSVGESNAGDSESGSASSGSRKSGRAKKGKATAKAKSSNTTTTKKPAPNKKQKASAKAKKPTEKAKPAKKGSAKTSAKSNGKSNGKKGAKAMSEPAPTALDLFTKQFREFERGLTRLEKVDVYGFFVDPAPPEFEEQYDNQNAAEMDQNCSSSESKINYPSHPPFNWEMVRRRHAQGRYILDVQKKDEGRLEQIKRFLTEERGDEVASELPNTVSILHGKGINWDLFRQDVFGMCDSSLERNAEDVGDGKPGSLLFAVNKIKQVSELVHDDSKGPLIDFSHWIAFVCYVNPGVGYDL
jgi:hypothetical protein